MKSRMSRVMIFFVLIGSYSSFCFGRTSFGMRGLRAEALGNLGNSIGNPFDGDDKKSPEPIILPGAKKESRELYNKLKGKSFAIRTLNKIKGKFLYWKHPSSYEKYFGEDKVKGEHILGVPAAHEASLFFIDHTNNKDFIHIGTKSIINGESNRMMQQWDAAKKEDKNKNRVVFHNKNKKSHESWHLVESNYLFQPYSGWDLHMKEKDGKFYLEAINDERKATPFTFILQDDLKNEDSFDEKALTNQSLYNKFVENQFAIRTKEKIDNDFYYWQHPSSGEKYFNEDRIKGEHIRGTSKQGDASFFTMLKAGNDIFIRATQKIDDESNRLLQQWDATKSSDHAKNRAVFHNKNTGKHEAWQIVDGKFLMNPHSKWYLYFKEKNGKRYLEVTKDKNKATAFEFIAKEGVAGDSKGKNLGAAFSALSNAIKEQMAQAARQVKKLVNRFQDKPVVAVIKKQDDKKVGFLVHDESQDLAHLKVQPSHINTAAQFMLIAGKPHEFFVESLLPLKKDGEEKRILQHINAKDKNPSKSVYFNSANKGDLESWSITDEGFIQNNTSKWYWALDGDNNIIMSQNKNDAIKVEFSTFSSMKSLFTKITPHYRTGLELVQAVGLDETFVMQVWDDSGLNLGYVEDKADGSNAYLDSCGKSLKEAAQFTLEPEGFLGTNLKSINHNGALVEFQGKALIFDKKGLVKNKDQKHLASLGDGIKIDKTTDEKKALRFEIVSYKEAEEREKKIKESVHKWMKE